MTKTMTDVESKLFRIAFRVNIFGCGGTEGKDVAFVKKHPDLFRVLKEHKNFVGWSLQPKAIEILNKAEFPWPTFEFEPNFIL